MVSPVSLWVTRRRSAHIHKAEQLTHFPPLGPASETLVTSVVSCSDTRRNITSPSRASTSPLCPTLLMTHPSRKIQPKRRRSSAQPSLGGPSRKVAPLPIQQALYEESEPEDDEVLIRKAVRSKKTVSSKMCGFVGLTLTSYSSRRPQVLMHDVSQIRWVYLHYFRRSSYDPSTSGCRRQWLGR